MLQGRVLLALLIVVIWCIVPVVIKQWGRVPHTHILVGPVTDAELAAHLAFEQEQMQPGDTLEFRSGWILSVPFGDLGALLAFLLVVAPVSAHVLRVLQQSVPLLLLTFSLQAVSLTNPHPPPRSYF